MLDIDISLFKKRYPFAEQALKTIYLLSEYPDQLCGDILKLQYARAFSIDTAETKVDLLANNIKDKLNLDSTIIEIKSESIVNKTRVVDVCELSKFCFLVGHIAIKQIVHIENIESEWKRLRAIG